MGDSMRIQQVVIETRLSKRAIHHYIKEKLITPDIDQGNGYFVFSDDDIKKLRVIRLLRSLDIPLADIQNILDYPLTVNYYLTKVLREMSRQKYHMAWKEECVEDILDGLDHEPTWEQLLLRVENAPLPPGKEELDDVLDSVDARMLSLYLLGNYIHDLEMNEYRRYLWDKLQRYIVSPRNKDLVPLCEYLYTLDPTKIKEVFAQRNHHMDYIAALTPEMHEVYVNNMEETIRRHICDFKWVMNWKRAYEPYLLPSIVFYVSPASEIMKELSPRFSAYVRNINICCSKLKDYLDTPEGQPLLKEIQQVLGGYIDVDRHNYGVLESMISFKSDMYR